MVIERDELALYLHIPFCRNKCAYCNYYSIRAGRKKQALFVKELTKEIKSRADNLSAKVTSIYIGGGTPSLLTNAFLAAIMNSIEENYFLAKNSEITLEVNPLDLQKEKTLRDWQQLGINRISLGVQSLKEDELNLLGRDHGINEAKKALAILAQADFNYSVDLISALPGQQASDYLRSLELVLNYSPKHISSYNLQIEPNTELNKLWQTGELLEISEEEDAKAYEKTREILTVKGYRHYEISNYALPGYSSHHNLAYWQFRPYAGFGPAACSFDMKKRRCNIADLNIYLASAEKESSEIARIDFLTIEDLIKDYIFTGLRLTAGISKKDFATLFKRELKDIYEREINDLVGQGLLIETPNKIRLSNKGLLLANQVFTVFL